SKNENWWGRQRQNDGLQSPGNKQKGTKAGDLMKWGKPKKREMQPGAVRLKDFLNAEHPLSRLASVGNWEQFERQFGKFYGSWPLLVILLLECRSGDGVRS